VWKRKLPAIVRRAAAVTYPHGELDVLRERSANGAGGAGERQIAGFGGRQSLQSQYRSIVCSTAENGLAELGRAIEELAAAADMARDASRPGPPAPPGDADDQSGPDVIMTRLAALWAMLAEIDPEIGRRMRGYLS
jgi:hypothetical protein